MAINSSTRNIVPLLPSGPTQTPVARISLAPAETPETRTNHSLVIRARTLSGTGTVVLRANLYQGLVEVVTDLESTPLTASFADYTLSIPDWAAEIISDYSNLEVQLWAYSATGESTTVEVAEIALILPVAGGPVIHFGAIVAPFTFAKAVSARTTRVFAATIAGIGTTALTFRAQRRFSTSIAGSSTVVPKLRETVGFLCIPNGVATLQFHLTGLGAQTRLLSTTVQGLATVLASSSEYRRFTTTILGKATTSVNTSRITRLLTSPLGAAAVSVNVRETKRLVTTIQGRAVLIKFQLSGTTTPPIPAETTDPLDRRQRYRRWEGDIYV